MYSQSNCGCGCGGCNTGCGWNTGCGCNDRLPPIMAPRKVCVSRSCRYVEQPIICPIECRHVQNVVPFPRYYPRYEQTFVSQNPFGNGFNGAGATDASMANANMAGVNNAANANLYATGTNGCSNR